MRSVARRLECTSRPRRLLRGRCGNLPEPALSRWRAGRGVVGGADRGGPWATQTRDATAATRVSWACSRSARRARIGSAVPDPARVAFTIQP